MLYGVTAVAAFTIGLVPLLSRPILARSLEAFQALSLGGFYSSLVGTLILFAVPVTLLGCVSPFAVRLSMTSLEGAGSTAGSLYALSTAGSIAGTFIPTLLLIPRIGTYRTFYLFALALLSVSLIGLVRMPARRSRMRLIVAAVLMLGSMFAVTGFGYRGFIRPVEGNRTVIWQGESAYNFIQVVENRESGAYELVLNEGHAIHSLYYPKEATQPLTRGPWDYFTVGPYFTPQQRADKIKSIAFIGLAGGTATKRMTDAYGLQVQIDGVEIDPTIVAIGRRYFDMREPNLHVIVQDGRYFLKTTEKRYDVVAVDAYHQPYIPFQLTTKEFFAEVRDRLNDNGSVIVNAGRTSTDYRLVEVISQTMRAVFPNVYLIDTPGYTNTMVIGTKNPSQLADFAKNIEVECSIRPQSPIVTIGEDAIAREVAPGPKVFTDDLAPVEDLIDRILLDYARKGGS